MRNKDRISFLAHPFRTHKKRVSSVKAVHYFPGNKSERKLSLVETSDAHLPKGSSCWNE